MHGPDSQSYVRFSQVVVPAGGADKFLEQRYRGKQDALMWAEWMEQNFPPSPSVEYAGGCSLVAGSPVQLRPWQLGFRSDQGINGYSDPEEAENLLDLILNNGFCGPIFS